MPVCARDIGIFEDVQQPSPRHPRLHHEDHSDPNSHGCVRDTALPVKDVGPPSFKTG
jgi:hypothetical protein